MAETLTTLSVVSLIVAALCAILAAVLFIVFKIPTVIGDLSGRTARKSIARMRSNNEKSGVKSYRTSSANAARGKLTSTMHGIDKQKSSKKDVAKASEFGQMPETGLLAENKGAATEESTALLITPDETDILTETLQPPASRGKGIELNMLEEVMLVHTDEVIQ